MNLKHQEIWNKYDTQVSTNILETALKNPDRTLFEVYHALSIARRHCEIEKAPDDSFSGGTFGYFQLGGSCEQSICHWGQTISSLVAKRLPSCQLMFAQKGLSVFSDLNEFLDLTHPHGEVLHRCDPVFQRLRSTENFFEYLENAARLHYELSNYPPIMRGSAAVNSWIINKIAQKKFQFTSSIRPELYDWTAFFETPEAYRGFYVIAASVNYIRQIPSLYERDKEFYDAIPVLMKEDPSSPGIIEQRETAWLRIQQNVKQYFSGTQAYNLTELQVLALQSIATGRLGFTPPSKEIRTLVDALKKQESDLPLNTLTDLLVVAQLTIEQLKDLLVLNDQINSRHLNSYGDEEKEAALAQKWRDLEVFRELDIEMLLSLRTLIPPDNIQKTPVCKDYPYNRNSVLSELHELAALSFASLTDIDRIPREIKDLLINPPSKETKSLSCGLKEAISLGGIRLQELPGLTLQEIEVIASPDALEQYRRQNFIRGPDLLKIHAEAAIRIQAAARGKLARSAFHSYGQTDSLEKEETRFRGGTEI